MLKTYFINSLFDIFVLNICKRPIFPTDLTVSSYYMYLKHFDLVIVARDNQMFFYTYIFINVLVVGYIFIYMFIGNALNVYLFCT